ncbi:MAG: sigma-70 family RNA polymerase sigma factor [Planctomycetota bacterium]|nr:sigma-70 family RNA polymerase sigma factor [Planctomycetota bacterium]
MPTPSQPSPPTSDDWLRLHRELVPELFRCVSRRVGADRTLAEDLVQETWLRALETWRKQGLPADPGAWLRTAAFNLTRNHFRRAAPVQLGEAHAHPAASQDDSARERAALVQRALAHLDAAQAELLVARHFDGHALAQLALAHRTSERAIEGRLHRARHALADVLRRSVPAGTAPERILAELLGDQP